MSDGKNKNEYTPGYSDDPFYDFPDFDSFDAISEAPSISFDEEKPADAKEEPVNEEYAYKESIDEDEHEENNAVASEETTEKSGKKAKKNPLFAAICVVMVFAIAACGTLAGFLVGHYQKSAYTPTDASSDTETDEYNAFAALVANYGNVTYPSGMLSQLNQVYAANDDVVGWLYIPDTNINTPVVQSKDNNRYLRYNFYGVYTKYGTTYADYRCKKSELSRNTVIYGHNMPSGTHFYDVNRYEDIEWYKLHPVIKYSTLYGDYTFLVYTAFYSTVKAKDDGGYIFNYIEPNMTQSSFKGFIEQVNQRALYKTAVDLKETDRVITLSTCNHTYDKQCGKDVDSRLVVIGRLLRSGENENVDVSVAKNHANYRRPQVWYDVKGKTNPYANSRSWKPSTK